MSTLTTVDVTTLNAMIATAFVPVGYAALHMGKWKNYNTCRDHLIKHSAVAKGFAIWPALIALLFIAYMGLFIAVGITWEYAKIVAGPVDVTFLLSALFYTLLVGLSLLWLRFIKTEMYVYGFISILLAFLFNAGLVVLWAVYATYLPMGLTCGLFLFQAYLIIMAGYLAFAPAEKAKGERNHMNRMAGHHGEQDATNPKME